MKRNCYNRSDNLTDEEIVALQNLTREEDVLSIEELYKADIWESTLEEDLYEYLSEEDSEYGKILRSYCDFRPGDIVEVCNARRDDGDIVTNAHKIMIITSKRVSGEKTEYEGYMLSSQVQNSNKYSTNPKYKSNIYIKDYSTILNQTQDTHKEAYIQIAHLFRFSSDDMSGRAHKGHVNTKFWHFVANRRNEYLNNVDVSQKYWMC